MRKFLLIVAAVLPASLFSQTSISCDSILQTSTCAGGNVIINFQTTGTFPWGNTFTAELSDNWGNWGNPLVLGSTPFTIGGNGIIFGTIPLSANFGFLYRVRIVSSNPADTSNDSPNTLIITQVAQLNQIISDPGDSACPGDTITLYALNPASEYLWSTGDTTWSIQVTQSGTYSVTTTDILTCQSTAYDTIVFDVALCTGINEQESLISFEVYPNPARHFVNVNIVAPGNNSWIELKDISGRRIISTALYAENTTLNIAGVSAGLYVLTVHTERCSVSRKVVIE